MIRTESLQQLPVHAALPALGEALDERGVAVLSAPPGTGKTTLVPLALAGLVPGCGDGAARRVLVAEPRRMAARAAARRMAWLLGEEPGGAVGFTVRGERRVGPGTRVEVVTTGVLLQRIQRDPELTGVDVVLMDECHERHLDADTAMAFLVDVRATLRPDLRLIAASATSDTAAWSQLLTVLDGTGPAPVVHGGGRGHAVGVVFAAPPPGIRPPHGTRVDPAQLAHVAATVRRALSMRDGDVLCFLPGVGEIGRVAGLLADVDAEVLQLHGRAPAAVQEAVLRGPGRRRRVILATSVAESSLTVPGVRIVVDSGLAREPRMDHARGLGSLTTVRVSEATATQRMGRAGREAPGLVLRCWAGAEDGGRPRFPAPEIAVADLAAFALQAACWGDPDASGLALLDPPPAGALAAARAVLTATGAVDASGRPTERGRAMARIGVHPRLARALLDGAREVGARRAAGIVALLSEEPPREYGDDLAAAWRAARRGNDAYGARWRTEARRLENALQGEGHSGNGVHRLTDDAAAGFVAALAFPERVARARGEGSYLMASGTRAELGDGTQLRGAPWVAVAVADRPVASASARVRLGAVIDEDTARAAAGALLVQGEEVHWSEERRDVVARRVERLGAVELGSGTLAAPDPDLVRAALLDGLRREGLGLLRWTAEAAGLRTRMAFLHRELGGPWPDVSDAALLDGAEDWLGWELGRARRRADLERLDAGKALERLLPWASGDAARLDELAPERIGVPSGSRIRVEYGEGQPVLAVKLQELFGLRETPRVAGGRVPVLVHLLSPAGRPAAVTADLESFWRDGYRAVRAELRGRYPRHPWPEDPAAAVATRRVNPRRG
ncbi:ATP-dependent helicase HrpB [Streptomyces morookaense]|uniref:ATP-dependent helicase HrpB n=1 Tax=Streptomyces morookaense TaxID=1970 RepID=A0A7Y7E7C4_STRMO|nr:ATP-dependent helicase HrpB [Streptomyces morookaense]NVK78239.1 ATP-dependent helicase HrpB [Streptomyces morookaense]GHF31218.1 ATP-dependent helicase [Streptomyces morookaense]